MTLNGIKITEIFLLHLLFQMDVWNGISGQKRLLKIRDPHRI